MLKFPFGTFALNTMARVHTAKTRKVSRKEATQPQASQNSGTSTLKVKGQDKDTERKSRTKTKSKGVSKVDESFKQEVLALGGDQEDIELLQDIDSDADVDENVDKPDVSACIHTFFVFFKLLLTAPFSRPCRRTLQK